MSGYILGSKSAQSQMFNEVGTRMPVTFIKTTSCCLVEIKTIKKHGYTSMKLGFLQAKNIKKPILGEFKKAGIKTPLRFLREFRFNPDVISIIEENGKKGIEIKDKKLFIGDEIKPEFFFNKEDMVTVSGISKGKGFQGVVKRHGFAGGPRTHGQSDRERAPGSIGGGTTPGRVYKGKKMAGRMGGDRISVKNLKVIEIRQDGILVKGLIPGPIKGLVEVKGK